MRTLDRRRQQCNQLATNRKWRARSRDGRVAKRSGPAGLAAAKVKELICQLAKDNMVWGYRRIVGEIKKLGHVVATSSVTQTHLNHPPNNKLQLFSRLQPGSSSQN